MNHTCLCLPSRSWFSFTDLGGMEESTTMASKQSAQDRYMTEIKLINKSTTVGTSGTWTFFPQRAVAASLLTDGHTN